MNLIEYPVVSALSWLICEALKGTRLPTRWLPSIAAAIGAVLGVLWFCLTADGSLAEAVVGGVASGLAATGANEALKLLFPGKE